MNEIMVEAYLETIDWSATYSCRSGNHSKNRKFLSSFYYVAPQRGAVTYP